MASIALQQNFGEGEGVSGVGSQASGIRCQKCRQAPTGYRLSAISCQLSEDPRAASHRSPSAIRQTQRKPKHPAPLPAKGEWRTAKTSLFPRFYPQPSRAQDFAEHSQNGTIVFKILRGTPPGGHTPFAVRYSPDAENKPKHSASSPANGDQEQISRPTDGLVMTNPKRGAFIHP